MQILLATAAFLVCAASCLAQGYVCAEGGGTGSGPWAAEMYGWMAEKGQKGAAVIIGAVELDAPDKPDSREAALLKAGASSVKSLVITEKNADTQEVYDAIAAASIVFIRGGSQSRYVEMWKGTKTEAAIRAVFAKGGVVGGTSAGCAILGDMSYDAIHGSLKPEEVVKDGRHPDLTLTKGFLGLVPGVLFDTHFGERARLPRLAVMLAHCGEKDLRPVGIGLDPRTALCVSPDGMGVVLGEGCATFLDLPAGTDVSLTAGKPPTVTGIQMSVAKAGTRFDTRARRFPDWPQRPEAADREFHVEPFKLIGKWDEPRPARESAEEAVAARIAHEKRSDPVVFVRDPYGAPNPVMKAVNTKLLGPPGMAEVYVLIGTGAVAQFGGSSIISAPDSAESLVVIDRWRSAGALGRYQQLTILAPGWSLNVATGVISRPKPVIPPAAPHMGSPSPSRPWGGG